MTVPVQPQIAPLLRRQHGVVSRQQLIAEGVSDRWIERSLRAGRLVRVHAGTYRDAGTPETVMQAHWAALLAAGPGAVLSHRTAASLWGLRGIEPAGPELSVVHARPRLVGCHLHRMQTLGRPDVVELNGQPITSVARTLLDVGAVVRPNQVSRAAIDALHRRLVGWGDLADVLIREGRRGRAGTGPLRRFMAREDPGVAALESELEVRFWEVVQSFGLPEPDRQHRVRLGARSIRVDFAYPGRLIAMEVDGRAWHGAAPDRRRDRLRDAALADLGWLVLRFGWEEVVRNPGWVAEAVRAALASRPLSAAA